MISSAVAALLGLALMGAAAWRVAKREHAQQVAINAALAQLASAIDRQEREDERAPAPATTPAPVPASIAPEPEKVPLEWIASSQQWQQARSDLEICIGEFDEDPRRERVLALVLQLDRIAGLTLKPTTQNTVTADAPATNPSDQPLADLIEALAPYVTDEQAQPLLAAARAAALASATTPADSSEAEQRDKAFRQMISQFARDSRDMLGCIRRLEAENAALLQAQESGQQAA